MPASTASIELVRLRKSYGPVEVLRGVDLEFRAGEVHALLGANGAGKSTLLGCLSGAVRPTSGSIVVDGQAFQGFAPREALDAGISIIYQHFQLAPTLSVSDNVFLGDEIRTQSSLLDRRKQRAATSDVLQRINLNISPDALVEDLSVGEQQGVEIARSVRREPRLLILDEPTAALGKHEVEALLALVRRLAHDLGVAVVYVTHLLGEVMDVADRVTILREGQVLWTRERNDVVIADIVEAISPGALSVHRSGERSASSARLASFEGFRTAFCGPLDLDVREGEIIGVYGMLGSGRTDLLETIAGARSGWEGKLRLGEADLDHGSVAQAMAAGVALVASDRISQSLFPSLTAIENLMMPHYPQVSRLWRNVRKEHRVFAETARKLHLNPPSPETAGGAFSGGNAQKLMLGRWLAGLSDVRLLLLDEPTQGVDIGSRAKIYELLRAFTEERPGRAVIFATSDPEEALALADRIAILINGQLEHVVEPTIEEAQLLSLAQTIEVDHRQLALRSAP
ncbi:sugar ABC transporter ATP-binding protein [Methylopila musalis]|uniref:Sugar ABC transporter ATP-binding protein n=1 Tax=Methylopila musalis TaxID=1134781 RepID=A0ABW3Z2Z8_9HYPH